MTPEELIKECKLHGIDITIPTGHTFTVIARYYRGLGPEYINVGKVTTKTIQEAYDQAEIDTQHYFATTPSLKNAEINEIRISPYEF